MEDVSKKQNLKKASPKKTNSKTKKTSSLDLIRLRSPSDEKWGQLQNDMSKAISFWESITKKYDGLPNPEDHQLQQIKLLLKDLQKKLSHFS